MSGSRDFYVITVRGERGPLDRAGMRELVASRGIQAGDQVRNAFGRPLGSVAQVLATPSDRQGAAAPVAARQPVRRSQGPAIAIIVGVILVPVAILLWLALRPDAPVVAENSAAPAMQPRAAPAAGSRPASAATIPPGDPTPAAKGAGDTRPAALPATTLPDGWRTLSIGNEGSPAPVFAGSEWTVKGAGHDIWGSIDQFRFVHTSVTGDATLTAHVLASDGKHQFAKPGIMLRASAAPDAPYVLLVVPPSGNVEFNHRATPAGPSAASKQPTASLPLWLRLTRRGAQVTGSNSADGVTWRPAGSVSFPAMSGPLLAGLVACSREPGRPMTVRFADVRVTTP